MLKLKFDHKFKVLLNNNFTKNKSYYETSILDESKENIKINKKELLKENIENYKNKLLSSYWTEINLIGYKIELLEKQKVEYLKEKSRILYIGNKISK
uniref:Uncharacterized protein n=1 Tax=Meloidogyne enterolobii TaxID=390850 RepID=A0A6V7W0Z4_MELEN|nr:unnamed protein product [Meloidogyne enterolobii]